MADLTSMPHTASKASSTAPTCGPDFGIIFRFPYLGRHILLSFGLFPSFIRLSGLLFYCLKEQKVVNRAEKCTKVAITVQSLCFLLALGTEEEQMMNQEELISAQVSTPMPVKTQMLSTKQTEDSVVLHSS